MPKLMIDDEYARKAVDYAVELLAIDSPSGFTARAVQAVRDRFLSLGYPVTSTAKGGLVVDLGGRDGEDALLLQAHIDTIGAMVAEIKSSGRLRVSRIGGLHPAGGESENVRVYTRSGRVIEGTLQLCNASVHVNTEYDKTQRTFDNMEVLLDAEISSEEEAREHGLETGDYVCLDPRTHITQSGYLKSRFLDDKLSVGILLAFAEYIRDHRLIPSRHLYAQITVYEEVGYGGSSSVPAGVTEVLSLDMGCVGDGLRGSEHRVSICAKDAGGPYNYDMVGRLIDAAKQTGADYAVDVYTNYSSDALTTLRAGYDVRHGLIGPGVYASHGYERSHMDGVLNTLLVLEGFVF